MSKHHLRSEAYSVIAAAIDDAIDSALFPPTLALAQIALPDGLELSSPERDGMRLLRNLVVKDAGAIEFVPVPTPDEGELVTVEDHGLEVAEVLDRWSVECRQSAARAVLSHLVFLIQVNAQGMTGPLARKAHQAIESYLLGTSKAVDAGPTHEFPGLSRLFFLVPVCLKLSSAMRIARIAGDKRAGTQIVTFILELAPSYITADHADEIGYALSLLDVLTIFPKVMPRADLLRLRREAERICTGRLSHQIAVEALLDHPDLPQEERLDVLRRWAEHQIQAAVASSPNDAMGIYLHAYQFCHCHGLTEDPVMDAITHAITTVAPHLELHRDRIPMPRGVTTILNHEIARITGCLSTTTSLSEAFAIVAGEPPPLPRRREGAAPDDESLDLEVLKLDDRNLPQRSVPIDDLPQERGTDARVRAMVVSATVSAAALDFIGERFNPSEAATLAALPEFHVLPENHERFARALCEFWSGKEERFDRVQSQAVLLLEGLLREAADRLRVTDYRPPLRSNDRPHTSDHDGLKKLLPKLTGREEVNEHWIEAIDYITRRPGEGLNLRNDTAHALNGAGRRVFTGLALHAGLYLASVLGFRNVAS